MKTNNKKTLKLRPFIYPVPAFMVSCGTNEKEYNIITISWTGTICTSPPMCYISIRKDRYSYDIIKRTKEFVINYPTEDLAYATDWCGINSGKDFNKFKEMKLTPMKAQIIDVPVIAESPMNIECKVVEIKQLGSHDMFIADVVAINADKNLFENDNQLPDMFKTNPIAYFQGNYYKLKEKIGKFGYTGG